MIVIGTDTHKRTHTCGAVFAGTDQRAGELTAPACKGGFAELLDWGRELDAERIWALEDCRHVSGSFERFLVASGERVVRVPPKLMGESRRGERTRGKSDPIDALAVARAALREGPETLPGVHLDDAALELKLLLDHREDLVVARSEDQQRLRWHLHDLWPDFEQADRRDRRGGSLRLRRQAGAPRRHRSDPCLLGQPHPPAPRPWRQPSTQLRGAPHRGDPRENASPGAGLPRTQASGGQVKPRSVAVPEAPPHTPGLAAVE
jgi:transposase